MLKQLGKKSQLCGLSFLSVNLPGELERGSSASSVEIANLCEDAKRDLADPKLFALLSRKLMLPGRKLKRGRKRPEGFDDLDEEAREEASPLLATVSDKLDSPQSSSILESTHVSSCFLTLTFPYHSVFLPPDLDSLKQGPVTPFLLI